MMGFVVLKLQWNVFWVGDYVLVHDLFDFFMVLDIGVVVLV